MSVSRRAWFIVLLALVAAATGAGLGSLFDTIYLRNLP